MDSIRKKVDYYTHTIWGRWVCNALVALCAFVAMKALLEYGLSIKNSMLLDFIDGKMEVETFAKYAPIVTAVATFIFPGVGPIAAGLVMFTAVFAVCPYMIALAALALLFAAPCNKIIKGLATLMPVAVMQFSAEQMDKLGISNTLLTVGFGFALMFIIAYASQLADKTPYAMSAPILFVMLAVPAGFFGKFKHISFMKAYWLEDKTFGYFKEGIDNYPLDYLKELLIILVVFIVVMVVFTVLLSTKKTALAKMGRDKRDAVAFGITTVVLIAALVGLKAGLKLEDMQINYVMIIVQMIVAYLATRVITKHDESLNTADDEKLKKFSKFTSILAILAIVAGIGYGGYWYYQSVVNAPAVDEKEAAIELNYDPQNDSFDLPFGTTFDEELECAWIKFTSKSEPRKCAAVFDKSKGQKMVKAAYLYDATGENLISEMPQYQDGEKPFQSYDFATPIDDVFYIKVEFGEHTGKDELLVHVWADGQ